MVAEIKNLEDVHPTQNPKHPQIKEVTSQTTHTLTQKLSCDHSQLANELSLALTAPANRTSLVLTIPAQKHASVF